MKTCRRHMRTLLLGLICVVGHACSSSDNEGEPCGGFAGLRCTDDEYCDYTGNDCGIADGAGVCKRRPDACPDIFSPKCACDGMVYPNECDAARHGLDVSDIGSCD